MAATDVPSVNIVHKVLNPDNYELWSFRVKTYLEAEDLWSVVKPTNEPPRLEDDEFKFNIWKKKNAKALHAIHICCGDDMFPFVNGLDTAKAAWDKLEDKFKSTIYQFPDKISLGNTINDVEESEPWLAVEDIRRAFPNIHVGERDVEYIRHRGREFGGIRNGMFIYAVANEYLDVIKTYLLEYPQVLKATSSSTGMTALHCAVAGGNLLVVKELVDSMSKEDLEVQGIDGTTAFGMAASGGHTQIAKYMVEKNERLVTIRRISTKSLPLLEACQTGKWDIAGYLYPRTPLEALTSEDNGREGAQLISWSFYSQEFDIALDLISKCPTLIFSKDYSGHFPLYTLATMSSAFLTEAQLSPLQKWIYQSIQIQPAVFMEEGQAIQIQHMVGENIEDGQGVQIHPRHFIIHTVIGCFRGLNRNLLHLLGFDNYLLSIHKKKLAHVRTLEMLDFMCKVTKNLTLKQIQEGIVLQAMFRAVERGNVVFVRKMCIENPILLTIVDGKEKSLLQFSIECRQEKVYCLMLGLLGDIVGTMMVSDTDKFGNSLLHSAGWLSSTAIAQLNKIQGAALQLQRELQWFKEVERIVPLKIRDMVNNQDHMTPHELFTMNHKEMVKEGQAQMKEIASSCTVVGALIVTTMFAAAFDVPQGTNGDKKIFKTFIISDSISLFSSTASIVIFLGILTSRYAENDFLKSLPQKMIIGLFTLFLSIATMMIAFVSALVIMLPGRTWIIILAGLLASIPIISFVWMQFPLLFKLLVSTFERRRFHKQVEDFTSKLN